MMRILPLALVLLAVFPALAQPPRLTITGGWGKTLIDAEVRQAAAYAITAIKTKQPRAKLARITAAERQVVAGLNYRVHLTLADKSRWEAVVWKKLDGKMEVVALTPIRRKP